MTNKRPFKVFVGGRSSNWLEEQEATKEQILEQIRDLDDPVNVAEVIENLESDLMDNKLFEKRARKYSIYKTALSRGQSPDYISRQDALLQGEVGDPDKKRCDPYVGGDLYTYYMEYYVNILQKWHELVSSEYFSNRIDFIQKLQDGTFYDGGEGDGHEEC